MGRTMTQEERNEILCHIEVEMAYLDGRTIQAKGLNNEEWHDIGSRDIPAWNWLCFDYRIKPEPPKPTYRPFENAEEVMDAIKEHGCWIISGGTQYRQITGIGYGCNPDVVKMNGVNWMKLSELFEAVWADDKTPVGKLIEE